MNRIWAHYYMPGWDPSEQLPSFLGDQPFLLGLLGDSWGLSLSVAIYAKKPFTASAFSASSVTNVAAPFSNGPTFPLVFLLVLVYLKKPFLLSLTSLAKFSSRWTLSFLIQFLHNLTASQYSFQVTCLWFHLLCVFGFWQNSTVHPHRWALTSFAQFLAYWD